MVFFPCPVVEDDPSTTALPGGASGSAGLPQSARSPNHRPAKWVFGNLIFGSSALLFRQQFRHPAGVDLGGDDLH
jgi:hypothetical protein